MCAYADRAHARATATVGNTKGFVQVEVRYIGAEFPRCRQSYQCIQVGAIHVYLPAVLVDKVAQFDDGLFEYAMGGGVGDHDRRQVLRVAFGFAAQVLHIHVTVGVAFHDYHAHAGQCGAGRVGAVGGGGYQADRALMVAAALVVAFDRQQAGVFTLRARVRLHGDGVVAGALQQHVVQLRQHLGVALGLLGRCKRMQPTELRPGDRQHLGGGVELHGATAQRNHGAVKGDVLVFQAAHVAQHFGFRVIFVEQGVLQVIHVPLQAGGDAGELVHFGVQLLGRAGRFATAEYVNQRQYITGTAGLIQ